MNNYTGTLRIVHLASAAALAVFSIAAGNAHAIESFTASPDNPVLVTGDPGAWDEASAAVPHILIEDGTWYMFYFGQSVLTGPSEIGFATSNDGVNWVRAACNPILAGDGTGFDAGSVTGATVRVSDGTWHMYYVGSPAPVSPPVGAQTGYATAPAPCGPWTRLDTPVLSVGGPGAWDADAAMLTSVVEANGGFIAYYSGSQDFPSLPTEIGLATSADGIAWTKHDDPATTAVAFAESDPVLRPGPPGSFDSSFAWLADVIHTDGAWEMYYSGFAPGTPPAIGYATSGDGINWVKSLLNPVYSTLDDPIGVIRGLIEAPHVVDTGNERLLYYTYGRFPGPSIGLALSDIDGDGIADFQDNCILIANDLQIDTNGDSIGNQCDPDIGSNIGAGVDDCLVNFPDLQLMKDAFFSTPADAAWNPDADLTGPAGQPDGSVSFPDLERMKTLFFGPPGPSAAGCN